MRPVHFVVAADRRGIIGRDGDLPWRLPDDLKHFKQLTLGHTVLMGRKTWQSLGRPLPQRDNWVVSRDPALKVEGAHVFQTLEQALKEPGQGPLMVIGGAQIYRALLPFCQRIHLTRVHAQVDGDAGFPLQALGDFVETACVPHPADQRHAYAFDFVTLERRLDQSAS